jgi:hypothetical protein
MLSHTIRLRLNRAVAPGDLITTTDLYESVFSQSAAVIGRAISTEISYTYSAERIEYWATAEQIAVPSVAQEISEQQHMEISMFVETVVKDNIIAEKIKIDEELTVRVYRRGRPLNYWLPELIIATLVKFRTFRNSMIYTDSSNWIDELSDPTSPAWTDSEEFDTGPEDKLFLLPIERSRVQPFAETAYALSRNSGEMRSMTSVINAFQGALDNFVPTSSNDRLHIVNRFIELLNR